MSAAVAQLERILSGIDDPADRAFVVRHMPAWLRRARRLTERDAAVRELAAERYAELTSGREIARRMVRDLTLYRAAGRLSGPVPTDPRRASVHRLLALCEGQAPSVATLRRALAGIGSDSPEPLRHDRASTTREDSTLEVA